MVEATHVKIPKTIDEALALLAAEKRTILAGGTDLMVRHKMGSGIRPSLPHSPLYIGQIKALKKISKKGRQIKIGAAANYADLISHEDIPQSLKKAMGQIAAPAIRNRATIGGNICNASPAGDTLPLLYIYRALLLCESVRGQREVPIEEFITGPGKTVLADDEMLVAVILRDAQEDRAHFHFEKVGNRKADAIAKVSFAAMLELSGEKISAAALSFGCVGPTVVAFKESVYQLLMGKTLPLSKEDIAEVSQLVASTLKPIDDHRSTASYRLQVALNLLEDFLSIGEIKKEQVFKGNFLHTPSPERLESLANHYVVVENGVIKDIQETLDEKYKESPCIDFGSRIVIPGFVDLHLHAPQLHQIGLGMDYTLLEWLGDYTFRLESKFESLDHAKAAYSEFVEALIQSGTTRSSVFATIHLEATKLLMKKMREAGVCGYVGKINMDRNCADSLKEECATSLAETEALCKEFAADINVAPIITPRFSPSCSDQLLAGLGELAMRYGVPVQSHVSENLQEIEWVKELFPDADNYLDTYNKTNLLPKGRTLMAHGIHLEDAEKEMIKEKDVCLVHCPSSNLNLSSGIMPLRELRDKGLNLGLGSDIGGGSKIEMNAVVVSAIQSSKVRAHYRNVEPLPFSEALYMATKGGGSFFGKVGSFELGYEFDALAIDIPSNLEIPLTNEEKLLRFIYSEESRYISDRFCRGREL